MINFKVKTRCHTTNSGNLFHAIFNIKLWHIPCNIFNCKMNDNIMQSLRSESNILMTSANLSKFNVSTYFMTVRYSIMVVIVMHSWVFVKIANHLIPYWLPLAQKSSKCMFELLHIVRLFFVVTPSKLTPNWILTSPVKCNSCKRKQNGLCICIVDPS